MPGVRVSGTVSWVYDGAVRPNRGHRRSTTGTVSMRWTWRSAQLVLAYGVVDGRRVRAAMLAP